MRVSLQELSRNGLYIGALFTLVLFLFLLDSPSAAAASATPASSTVEKSSQSTVSTYVTTASYLNVRAAPNARSKILDVVKKGTKLAVVGKANNDWLQLEGKGYVHSAYAIPKDGKEAARTLSYSSASAGAGAANRPAANPASDAQGDSGLTAEDIRDMFEGTGFENEGLEYAVLQVEDDYGINAYFTIAVMRLESGNGNSKLAKTKNNLFGLNSSSGYVKFATKEASILRFGELISRNYIGKGYTTVDKIGKKYCPANPKWSSKVKALMKADYRSTA
ncbi:glucosaminidase domain-containing protein [Cohnella fermenti]|nr:glucosaminidase domain-containing protein [Cohnella fermenti]